MILSVLGDIAAGGGIGLLLGVLLGLSVSPVVQGVVVAITALLGTVLGNWPSSVNFHLFAGIASAAESSSNPSATLTRELKCAN